MFTVRILDRLSEWSANISIVFFAGLVLPALLNGVADKTTNDVISGLGGTIFWLWISLRLSRIADKKEQKKRN